MFIWPIAAPRLCRHRGVPGRASSVLQPRIENILLRRFIKSGLSFNHAICAHWAALGLIITGALTDAQVRKKFHIAVEWG
jgi:hypothetical protein